MNVVEIEVFGKDYKIQTDKSQQEINQIIKYFNKKVKEMKREGGLETPKDVLVLTLLNVVEDHLELKTRYKNLIDNDNENE